MKRPEHFVDAALAATATLTAAWPISTLLAEPTWLRGTVLLLAVIALSGIGARSLALHGGQVLTAQLVCLVLAAGAIYGRGHLWHGLPTFETLRFSGRLVLEAVATAQKYAVPAPSTPGLLFVIGGALGLAALAVDFLAVTCRSPSLAGLPLLTVFLAAVANRGATLPLLFFVAAAAMWLLLVARAGGTLLRRWGTTVVTSRTPVPQGVGYGGRYEQASMARMLGAVALVAAVAVPAVLPKAAPTFLAPGLGRSPSGKNNTAPVVGFSQDLDMAADLRNPSRAPVLQYTTADTSPPPLRIGVGTLYREPGVWLTWGRPWGGISGKPELSLKPTVPLPTGLSAEVPKRPYVLNVRRNLLADPNLAVPYPLIGADLPGVSWGAESGTQSVRVAERPDVYSATYWHLDPSATMLASAPALKDRDRHLFDLDLTLDGAFVGTVTTLTNRLTSGKTSTYDKAMAIQQYLRTDGGFTYSLTLAPPARNSSGDNTELDSLTSFLTSKRGYCVQFATAMVMMSRAAGIPARIALGFTPGTETKGVWTVVAADAHAWPELYLTGIGWTRFEPTPSRGVPPAYANPATSPGTAISGPSLTAAKAPLPGIPKTRDSDATSSRDGALVKVAVSPASMLHWLTSGWGPILIGCLTGLLGALVVPTAALWHRRNRLTRARTAAARVEVEVRWELLTSSLGDLGIAPAPSHTPRQLHAYYDREALLEGAASQALGRVVQTLERSRYAAVPPLTGSLSADARQVLRAAAGGRSGRDRMRAALWPGSGITALRAARARLAWGIGAPLRLLSIAAGRRSRP